MLRSRHGNAANALAGNSRSWLNRFRDDNASTHAPANQPPLFAGGQDLVTHASAAAIGAMRATWCAALLGGQLMLAGCQRASPPMAAPAPGPSGARPSGSGALVDAQRPPGASAEVGAGEVDAGAPAHLDSQGAASGEAAGWACWPMPNPPSTGLPHTQSYDSGAPDIVADRVTGLVWQRAIGTDTYLWKEAQSYCAKLVVGGARDWRLPTLIELTSLVDFTRVSPAIDRRAFPDPAQGNFWTSTPVAGNSGEAWYLAFSTGFTYQGHEEFLRIGARCVRATTRPRCVHSSRYVGAGAATVTDSETGLTWQRTLDGATTTWTGAKTYCQSLKLPGGGRWRLPSMKELQTLIDVGRKEPAIDLTAFPGSPMEQFWTSSALAGSSTDAWFVSFRLGAVNTIDKNSQGFVRCVRGS